MGKGRSGTSPLLNVSHQVVCTDLGCLADAAAAGADNGNYFYDPDGASEREEHGLGQSLPED